MTPTCIKGFPIKRESDLVFKVSCVGERKTSDDTAAMNGVQVRFRSWVVYVIS